jgi:hypothetical protein
LAKSWRQLVRWLVSDVPTRVAVTAEAGAEGDPSLVRIVVKVRDEEYKPLDNALVQLTIKKVGSQQGEATNYLKLAADASPSQAGTYQSDYFATEAGACTVEAVATQSDGKAIGHSATGWASDPAAAEFRSLKPNRAYLEELAKRTGGQVLTMEGLRDFVRQLPQRHAPVMEPWSKPLWQEPVVYLVALACFVAEWGIRRWKGLP